MCGRSPVQKVKKNWESFLRSHISMLSNGEEISVAEENALVLVRTFATIAFYIVSFMH
jgi:hypothetical protein